MNNRKAEILEDIEQNLETLTPRVVSNYSIELSVYLTYVSEQWADMEKAYNKVWSIIRADCKTDGEATKRAKATDLWGYTRSYELEISSIKEVVKSLKKRLQMLSDEANLLT